MRWPPAARPPRVSRRDSASAVGAACPSQPRVLPSLYVVFFLSGVAGLGYQIAYGFRTQPTCEGRSIHDLRDCEQAVERRELAHVE